MRFNPKHHDFLGFSPWKSRFLGFFTLKITISWGFYTDNHDFLGFLHWQSRFLDWKCRFHRAGSCRPVPECLTSRGANNRPNLCKPWRDPRSRELLRKDLEKHSIVTLLEWLMATKTRMSIIMVAITGNKEQINQEAVRKTTPAFCFVFSGSWFFDWKCRDYGELPLKMMIFFSVANREHNRSPRTQSTISIVFSVCRPPGRASLTADSLSLCVCACFQAYTLSGRMPASKVAVIGLLLNPAVTDRCDFYESWLHFYSVLLQCDSILVTCQSLDNTCTCAPVAFLGWPDDLPLPCRYDDIGVLVGAVFTR